MTRINKFLARATGMSRRAADEAIKSGRVQLNQRPAILGDEVGPDDSVALDNSAITPVVKTMTIVLNKPAGYVCSRVGQGSKTIYDLLPPEYHRLKPVGRLDKDSSGLILLTNDGELANKLTHPRYQKEKTYRVELDKKLAKHDKSAFLTGVGLEDGLSRFIKLNECSDGSYEVTLAEGRNRQVRRTFAALGYEVRTLQRTAFGSYKLDNLKNGNYKTVK